MLVTVPQAARRIGRNPETIRRWIRGGRLHSQIMGTQHFIEEADLEALVPKSEMAPLPTELEETIDHGPAIDWVALIRQDRNQH